MSEKYKIGLTRNRLYEPFNTVLFWGEYKGSFDLLQANKAMKMLCAKEPVITCGLELSDDSQAFLVSGYIEPELLCDGRSKDEIVATYNCRGIDTEKGLFSFHYSTDGYLVIAGHTIICDEKSLLRLAKSFVLFYERKDLNVEAMPVNAFGEHSSLPVDVASPLTDKLSSELEGKWGKRPVKYSPAQCEGAKRKYRQENNGREEIVLELPSERMEVLNEICARESVDLSSVVFFCFYKSLLENINLPKKAQKWVVSSDRRFFLQNAKDCSVGAFDGSVEISLNKKDDKKDIREQMKSFHLNCYKGVTSVFRSFYDDVLLMKLSPDFTDSAYMFLFGENKNKVSRRLAENYGCACEKMCRSFSCNLSQEYWAPLKSFDDIMVTGEVKTQYYTSLDFLDFGDKGRLVFRYNPRKITPQIARSVVKKAEKIMAEI